jgi:hypothetical protein
MKTWNPLLSNDIFSTDFSEVGRLSGTLTHWPDLQMVIKFARYQSTICLLCFVAGDNKKDDILLANKS